jgi:hypothetical protein
MTGSYVGRLVDASGTKQHDEPSLPKPLAKLGHRRLATNQHQGFRNERLSEGRAISVFKLDDGAHERIAPSLNVRDVSITRLAVTKRLADRGYVDPEAPFLDVYARPDMLHQFVLRDDLTWVIGKIDQDIQRPISEG